MHTKIVEAWSPQGNSAQFWVGAFDHHEWEVRSAVSGSCWSLLAQSGKYTQHSRIVLDLQTGEAAVFTPPQREPAHTDEQWAGLAQLCAYSDLNHGHQILVTPLYGLFLVWLYTAAMPFDKLPSRVELDAPFVKYAQRRTPKTTTVDGRQAYVIQRRQHPRWQ